MAAFTSSKLQSGETAARTSLGPLNVWNSSSGLRPRSMPKDSPSPAIIRLGRSGNIGRILLLWLHAGHDIGAELDRGIADDNVVASVVARHPAVGERGGAYGGGDGCAQGLRLLQIRGEDGPTHVETINGLSQALALEDPHHDVPHLLDLRRATAVLERVGPGAVDVSKRGERAMIQHALRKPGNDRLRHQGFRFSAGSDLEIVVRRTAAAVAGEEE